LKNSFYILSSTILAVFYITKTIEACILSLLVLIYPRTCVTGCTIGSSANNLIHFLSLTCYSTHYFMFRILFACSTSKSFSSEVKHSACEHCLAGHIYLFLYFHTCYLNDAKYHQMYNTNINLSWRK